MEEEIKSVYKKLVEEEKTSKVKKKINKVKKKISSNIIKKNTKDQISVIDAEICDHRLKLTVLNTLIIIILILTLYKLFIKPSFLHIKKNNTNKLYKAFKKYYSKYTNTDNIFLFIIFIFIIIIFLSFNVIELQNIGIILLITFITAIAQAGEDFLLGAIVSGITAYLFIRLKTYFNTKNHKLDECNIDTMTYIKHKFNLI